MLIKLNFDKTIAPIPCCISAKKWDEPPKNGHCCATSESDLKVLGMAEEVRVQDAEWPASLAASDLLPNNWTMTIAVMHREWG